MDESVFFRLWLYADGVKPNNDLVNFGVKKSILIAVKNCTLFERNANVRIVTRLKARVCAV